MKSSKLILFSFLALTICFSTCPNNAIAQEEEFAAELVQEPIGDASPSEAESIEYSLSDVYESMLQSESLPEDMSLDPIEFFMYDGQTGALIVCSVSALHQNCESRDPEGAGDLSEAHYLPWSDLEKFSGSYASSSSGGGEGDSEVQPYECGASGCIAASGYDKTKEVKYDRTQNVMSIGAVIEMVIEGLQKVYKELSDIEKNIKCEEEGCTLKKEKSVKVEIFTPPEHRNPGTCPKNLVNPPNPCFKGPIHNYEEGPINLGNQKVEDYCAKKLEECKTKMGEDTTKDAKKCTDAGCGFSVEGSPWIVCSKIPGTNVASSQCHFQNTICCKDESAGLFSISIRVKVTGKICFECKEHGPITPRPDR